MSDIVDPRVPPAGTPEAAAAAAAAPAAPAPAAEAPVVVAPVEVAPVAPTAEAPIVAPVVESPPATGTQPTLMEQFDRKQAEKDNPPEADDPKAEEAKPPEKEGEKAEEKKVEAEPEKPAEGTEPPEAASDAPKPPDAVAEPPAREPFKFEAKLPDGLTMSDERRGELEGVLGDFIATPTADNQQRLVDLHKSLVEENLNTYYQQWLDQFNATQREWEKQVRDDPIIGGGNHDEAMQAMAYVRDNFVSLSPRGSKEYAAAQKGFNEVLYRTGMGSNPYFLHMLHNISQVLNEPKMVATSEIRPMPAQINANGRPSIYKHPTSFRK